MIHNPAGNRGIRMSWSLQELPYLTQWKNSADLNSGYVTGIEPGTSFPYNRRIERHFGRVLKLQPGQTRHFTLAFTILDNAEEVEDSRQQIAAIAAGRSPQIQSTPEVNLANFN